MKIRSLLLISTLTLAAVANAAGVKDKKRWEQATSQVDSVRVEAEEACGIALAFSFDKESFIAGTDLTELGNRNMEGYCGDAFVAMTDLCDDDDYREAMMSVQSLSCSFDGSLKKPSANLADGNLNFSFNWDTANHWRVAKDYLAENL